MGPLGSETGAGSLGSGTGSTAIARMHTFNGSSKVPETVRFSSRVSEKFGLEVASSLTDASPPSLASSPVVSLISTPRAWIASRTISIGCRFEVQILHPLLQLSQQHHRPSSKNIGHLRKKLWSFAFESRSNLPHRRRNLWVLEVGSSIRPRASRWHHRCPERLGRWTSEPAGEDPELRVPPRSHQLDRGSLERTRPKGTSYKHSPMERSQEAERRGNWKCHSLPWPMVQLKSHEHSP